MRKAVLALLCLPLAANAQREVVLHFDLKNASQTDTITLSWGANNKSMTPLITNIPATETKDVTLPLNEPRVVVLGMKGKAGSMEMLLAPNEDVTISGRIRSNNKKTIDGMRVRGAAYQEEYTNAVHFYQSQVDSIDKVVQYEYRDIFRLISTSKQNGNEQAIADMYKTQHGKDYIERVIGSFKMRDELLEEIISQHKDNFMGPLLMIRLVGRLSKSYRDMYNSLSDAAKQSYYGREVKDEVYPPTLVGDIAPTVTVQNTEGNEKMLSFTRHGNKYLLLDFWASWCEPCHKEIPNLKRIYETYHAKGLDIIGISADKNVDDWKSTLEEQKEPWCNYIDINRQAISEYKVQYIPSIFILDADGNIIAEKLRGKELSDFIDKLFAE